MIRSRLGPTSFAIALAMTVFAGQAVAQDQAAIEKLVQMNKKALDDYDTLEWESAKKIAARRPGRGEEGRARQPPGHGPDLRPPGRRLHHGLQEPRQGDPELQPRARDRSRHPAVEGDRDVGGQRGVRGGQARTRRGRGRRRRAPPPRQEAQGPGDGGQRRSGAPRRRRGRRARRSPRPRTTTPRRRTCRSRSRPLDCPNEDEAIIDKAATLRCAVAPNLPVAKVFLLYQEPGKEEYTELEMKKSPKGWWVGKVPKKAVTGKSVKYYFEGRNAAGKAVVRNGELESPNFLLVMEEDAYREAKKKRSGENLGEDVENPLDVAEGPVKQSTLGAHRRGRRPGRPVRQAQVVDRPRRRQRLRLREGQRPRGGERLARDRRLPDCAAATRLPCPGGAWAGLVPPRARGRLHADAQRGAVPGRALSVHPAGAEVFALRRARRDLGPR